MQPLSSDEKRSWLEYLEGTVESHIDSFLEAGLALLTIRKERLYKLDGYKAFDEYLKLRWTRKITRQRAGQLIRASEVHEILETVVSASALPENEWQLRPLVDADLDDDSLIRTWQEAVELAQQDGVELSQKHVRQVLAMAHPEQLPALKTLETRMLAAMYAYFNHPDCETGNADIVARTWDWFK